MLSTGSVRPGSTAIESNPDQISFFVFTKNSFKERLALSLSTQAPRDALAARSNLAPMHSKIAMQCVNIDRKRMSE